MTRRAILDTPLSTPLYRDDPSIVDRIGPPTEPWIILGPRGGRYLALPPFRFRGVSDAADDYFIRDQVVVRWESAGTKYVRPGSRLARELDSQP